MATREFRRLKKVRRIVLLFLMSSFVCTNKSLLEISPFDGDIFIYKDKNVIKVASKHVKCCKLDGQCFHGMN